MAKMFPQKPLVGTLSNAERKVFYALKDLLSDDYTVFHSIPMYRVHEKAGGLIDGEVDFLLAHPNKGLVVMEVKGGGISHEASAGIWATTDSQGIIYEIKDPFEQAKNYKYLLIHDLRDYPLTRNFTYRIGHAVWFPDLDLRARSLGLSVQLKKITLDASDLSTAHESVSRLFNDSVGTENTKPLSGAGIDGLIRYLAPSWEIPCTLSAQLVDEDKQIIEATKSQYRVISLLRRVPRALVSGCAGSGKTLLALEKARRLSEEGQHVLVVCYNKKLAAWIRNILDVEIDVFHFHGLCTHFCLKADLPVPAPDPLSNQDAFFRYELPEALLNALTEVEIRYDAIIVDEGQDLYSNWWVPLQELLKEGKTGVFYIFFDDNQAIYSRDLEFPFSAPLFPLNENCRNTKLIHNEVTKFYKGEIIPQAIGPEGRKPEYIYISNEMAEKQILKQIVKRMVNEENVNPKNITILTPKSYDRSALKDGFKIGDLQLSWEHRDQQRIHCSTIHSFKGLESPVIILVELEMLHPEKRKELLYIGISRARNHLVIIMPEEKN